ncbi:MAG: beta-glucosidase [Parafilimonas sp.]|nr:beta-glucosidase [Parafilimonas sp.]
MKPASSLQYITKYTISVLPNLKSASNQKLGVSYQLNQVTTIDSSDKFPRKTDAQLLNLVQKASFNYYWIAGNALSGMAKERFSSDICTTGGTGFAVMSIPVAIKRNFITRADGLARVTKLVNFLDQNCTKYHGAFAHWINGNTGATIPFSPHDDGADIVETSYLMEGLLTAREYFNGTSADETNLRNTINKLYQNVDWSWFTNGQNTLYWHWSPNYGWDTYQQVNGWNEALITYVMAASSPTHPINLATYQNGWARNGAMKNGNTYYGVQLPLGPANGGPLFFEHYSFMGIDPNGLADAYANYQQQTTAHTQINYNYCVANPKHYNGYSDSCWGLTASDDNLVGYSAHEPNNDDGVLTPTAALSSFPYTPDQSMAALQFFYYKLGDKLWNSYYGFRDAFNLTEPWFDNDYLAIDQMPIVVMIENYRSQQIWNLFMKCKEVKKGMKKLGFTSPHF